ncbi:MAG: hypothetical protein ACREJ2_17430 [Planctomycetota bacterium]
MRKGSWLCLLALSTVGLMCAGCAGTPQLGRDRADVLVLRRNRALGEADDAGRSQRRLQDDFYRQIRYAVAKRHVTPADAAELPLHSAPVLMKLLTDPRFHRDGPTIVMLLGMIGGPAEGRFLRDYIENQVTGAIDESTDATLCTIPVALGYIAVRDDATYTALRRYLRLNFWRANIQWRFESQDRDMMAYQLVLATLDGLAISGRRSAAEYIRYVVDRDAGAHPPPTAESDAAAPASRILMSDCLESRAQQTLEVLALAK